MRWLETLVTGYAHWDRAVERVWMGGKNLLRGYLGHALTPAEQSVLSVALYKRWFAEDKDRGGLYEWERDWFATQLPPPPARVLVGGAGRGRESLPLLERGYRVDAFEPVASACATCAERFGRRGRVVCASYDDLVRAVQAGQGPLAAQLQEVRYDAVLLGWGSLSHVFGAAERRQLLTCCAALVPSGPVLASFFLQNRRGREGRLERLGGAAGRAHASLRGVRATPESLFVGSRYGLMVLLSVADIEDLGAAMGRQLDWSGVQSYPHVTFLP